MKKNISYNYQFNPPFYNDHYYHLYNRGVAKQEIFSENADRLQFLTGIAFFLETNPGEKLSLIGKSEKARIINSSLVNPAVEVINYCLMPNHFHLLVRQIKDNGITNLMKRALNSYTRYYNIKHDRVGSMFQGSFRAIHIEDDEQLLHLSRYIHLNPFVSGITDDFKTYPWSSYKDVIHGRTNRLCNPDLVIELAGGKEEYIKFVNDFADYSKKISDMQRSILE